MKVTVFVIDDDAVPALHERTQDIGLDIKTQRTSRGTEVWSEIPELGETLRACIDRVVMGYEEFERVVS